MINGSAEVWWCQVLPTDRAFEGKEDTNHLGSRGANGLPYMAEDGDHDWDIRETLWYYCCRACLQGPYYGYVGSQGAQGLPTMPRDLSLRLYKYIKGFAGYEPSSP